MNVVALISGPPLTPWQRTVFNELCQQASLTFSQEIFLNDTPKTPFFTGTTKKPTEYAFSKRTEVLPLLKNAEVCVTFGAAALWLLTDEKSLENFRNCYIESSYAAGLIVIPTYDVDLFSTKAWNERPAVYAALQKAKRKPSFPSSTIWIPQQFPNDLLIFEDTKIPQGATIAFDVETNGASRITEFSIAATVEDTLYVMLEGDNNESILSFEDELEVFKWLWRLCRRRDLTWVMHNSLYDLSYLVEWGFKPRGHIVDTMLWHHAMQPEMEKSLGFLAQMYLPLRPWKHLRTRAKYLFAKQEAL